MNIPNLSVERIYGNLANTDIQSLLQTSKSMNDLLKHRRDFQTFKKYGEELTHTLPLFKDNFYLFISSIQEGTFYNFTNLQ